MKYQIESYHDSHTNCYFYSYCARCQCFTINGTQNTVMPVNAVTENVFRTMGQSASLSSTSSFHFPSRFYPSLSRCDLLDRTAQPSAFQNLPRKVRQRALTVARVSHTSASIRHPPHPFLLRALARTSIIPPKTHRQQTHPTRSRADSSGESHCSNWAST